MTQSINELKSYTEYNVSTPTSVFTIGFQYEYNVDHVNVYVDGVEATAAGYTVQHDSQGTVTLTPAVPAGVVRLVRETNIDTSAHTFSAGAKFTAGNMDENFTQIRHSQQEVRDGFKKLSDDTYKIIDTLQDVGQAAQDAADAAEQATQTANDAAAQVNDKVSYEDFNNKPHNAMLARDAASAHPTSSILDASGETQQQVNYNGGSKWHSRVGGYKENERVVLTNGDIVKSIIDGSTNDPNSDMTGWELTNSTKNIFILNQSNSLMKRALDEKLNGEFASIKDGGAIGDGTLHTLQEWVDSGKFESLAAIQVAYPTATALTDSIDTVVIQTWIDTYPRPFIPEGAYVITKTLDFEGSGKEIYGESVSTYGDGSQVGTRFIHAFNGPLISFNTKTTTTSRGRHRVRGIALVSNDSYSGTAIVVQSSQNHIHDMSFYQFKDGGIRIKGRSYGTYIKTPSFDRCGSNNAHDITVDIDTGGTAANDYNTLTVITDLISETSYTGAISIVNSDPFYITRSYIEPFGSVSTKPMIDIKNSVSGNTKGWVYDNYIGSINGNGLAISAVGANLFVNHNMIADFNNGIYFATQTGACKGNIVRGYSGDGIQVASTAAGINNNAEVSGNMLLSKTSGAVHGIILKGAVNGGTLTSNIVRGKHQYGARLLSAHNFIISLNNILPSATDANVISNEGIYEDDGCTGNTVKANNVVAGTRAYRRYSWDYDRHVLSSTATPTAGVWKKGQIVEVPDPVAFGATGYICTVAGTGGASVWQKYGIIQLTSSVTYNPPSLPSGSQQSTTVTLTGAKIGDCVSCSFNQLLNGTRMWAEVTAVDTVTVYHRNDTGGTVDISSGTLTVKLI